MMILEAMMILSNDIIIFSLYNGGTKDGRKLFERISAIIVI